MSFSAIAAAPIFAPAPKVGALGEIGIPYVLYISTVSNNMLLLPGMACMQALQEQKPATEKSELIEAPLWRFSLTQGFLTGRLFVGLSFARGSGPARSTVDLFFPGYIRLSGQL